ncbi:Alcohol dehydrogenase superfamily [Macleaya cordata]|uniref:Alcohol dehydrogenase superfamily n=1 Tax=Macleaya cordata TaxID=56857 RepID=A0A200QXV6_MACCD|nr:Alcohol dehydrogenase superfamily [Macleaya cordata]
MSELQNEEEIPSPRVFGWAAGNPSGYLSPFTFYTRAPGKKEVTIKVLYCGICPADRRSIKCRNSIYPLIPGHEIVGEVAEVGDKDSSKFKVGDKVGVGCMIGPLHSCSTTDHKNCKIFDRNKNRKIKPEKYCSKIVPTYFDGSRKYGPGGFSDIVVVKERFVVRFPDNLPLAAVAPLLCAGVAVYSPMQFYGLNRRGLHLGVVELGSMGRLAVKFAKAFRLKVTVISSSPAKEQEAIERLGADSFLVINDLEQMQGARGTMDGIIDTLPLSSNGLHNDDHHHVLPLITSLLKSHGKMIQVGDPDIPINLLPELCLFWERELFLGRSTSATKQMRKTQEMIDFAAKHNITADVKVIQMKHVNDAMEYLVNKGNDIRFCFVVDVANSSLSAATPWRFEVKKWNAVAFWGWDTTLDNCGICRNQIMGPCIECEAAAAAAADDDDQASASAMTSNNNYCIVAWGVCNHAYHFHCINRWLSEHGVCPLVGQWIYIWQDWPQVSSRIDELY